MQYVLTSDAADSQTDADTERDNMAASGCLAVCSSDNENRCLKSRASSLDNPVSEDTDNDETFCDQADSENSDMTESQFSKTANEEWTKYFKELGSFDDGEHDQFESDSVYRFIR